MGVQQQQQQQFQERSLYHVIRYARIHITTSRRVIRVQRFSDRDSEAAM